GEFAGRRVEIFGQRHGGSVTDEAVHAQVWDSGVVADLDDPPRVFRRQNSIVAAPGEIDVTQMGNEPNRRIAEFRFYFEQMIQTSLAFLQPTEPDQDPSA